MTRTQVIGASKPSNQSFFSEKAEKYLLRGTITLLALAALSAVIYGGLCLGTRNFTLLSEGGSWGLTGAGGVVLLTLFMGVVILYQRSKPVGSSGVQRSVSGKTSSSTSSQGADPLKVQFKPRSSTLSPVGTLGAQGSASGKVSVSANSKGADPSKLHKPALSTLSPVGPPEAQAKVSSSSGSQGGGPLKVQLVPILGTFSQRESADEATLDKERLLLCNLFLAPKEYVKTPFVTLDVSEYYFFGDIVIRMRNKPSSSDGDFYNGRFGGTSIDKRLDIPAVTKTTTADLNQYLKINYQSRTFDELLERSKDPTHLGRLSFFDRVRMSIFNYHPLTSSTGEPLGEGDVEKLMPTLRLPHKHFSTIVTQPIVGSRDKRIYILKNEDGKITIAEKQYLSSIFETRNFEVSSLNSCFKELHGRGFKFMPQEELFR
jgi:hypothetical protein